MYIRASAAGFPIPPRSFAWACTWTVTTCRASLGAFLSTLDVERVENPARPQGTLFRQEHTGGAVSWVSAKAGPEFDSYVTVRAGDFGQQDVRAMVNVRSARMFSSAATMPRRTWTATTQSVISTKPTGGTDQESVGLALRWELDENWTIDARGRNCQGPRTTTRAGSVVAGRTRIPTIC